MTEAEERPIGERTAAPEGKELALLCARLLDERQLHDLTIFDLGEILQIANFFVLATGSSARHVSKAAEFVIEKLRDLGIRPIGVEGYERARWVLLDLGDVVVHLMVEEARRFYNLELLWGDCPQIAWDGEKP